MLKNSLCHFGFDGVYRTYYSHIWHVVILKLKLKLKEVEETSEAGRSVPDFLLPSSCRPYKDSLAYLSWEWIRRPSFQWCPAMYHSLPSVAIRSHHFGHSFVLLSIKIQCSLSLHFWRIPSLILFSLNKFACFSFINLSCCMGLSQDNNMAFSLAYIIA